MDEKNRRRDNQPGRSDGDYKPWLDRKTASMVACRMIARGCAICGTTESRHLVKDENGKLVPGERWAAVLDDEGQERFLCLPCATKEFPT